MTHPFCTTPAAAQATVACEPLSTARPRGQTVALLGALAGTLTLDWARPQVLPVLVVPGVGHFFHGQLTLLKTLVLRAFGAAA